MRVLYTGRKYFYLQETVQMSRRICSIWGQICVARFGVLFFMVTFGLATPLPSQIDTGARGAFEVTSGLGRKLYALADDQSVIDARKNLAADPKNVDRILQLSKAEAARRQYREAVATSTQGLAFAPKNADLYLERGHRELGLREFQPALNDLLQATRLAPENLDAHYHLGLAHYFLGEFDEAAASFGKARVLAKTDDSLIDCSNWLYVSLQRAGKPEQAAQALARITPDVKNTEPHLYFYLRLLHFYQGQLTEEAVLPPPPTGLQDLEGELSFNTVSYGVGNWRVYHHNRSGAIGSSETLLKGKRGTRGDSSAPNWSFFAVRNSAIAAWRSKINDCLMGLFTFWP
jgi:tetratricopeptide (TPR) repeat protein